MLEIRPATVSDMTLLLAYDRHVSTKQLARIIPLGHVLMAYADQRFVGWLRYGLFWDEIPFMNMLYLLEDERGKGYGRELVRDWESRMARSGYERVMTSSQADEDAQHFYRKLGYRDAGVLLLPEQAAEVFFVKDFA